METNTRVVTKAVCWQASGLLVMSLLGYAFTGSLGQGGALALASTLIGFVFYVLHEKLWARVQWGRVGRGAAE